MHMELPCTGIACKRNMQTGWSYRALVVFPGGWFFTFIEKGSGPQPSLINAALPLHTQSACLHVFFTCRHVLAYCMSVPSIIQVQL